MDLESAINVYTYISTLDYVQIQNIKTYEHNEVKRSIERKNIKTEVRKFNFEIITSVNAILIIEKSYTFTYMTIYA